MTGQKKLQMQLQKFYITAKYHLQYKEQKKAAQVTLQNEPGNATASYMSMLMQPTEAAAFLKVIGPAFQAAFPKIRTNFLRLQDISQVGFP